MVGARRCGRVAPAPRRAPTPASVPNNERAVAEYGDDISARERELAKREQSREPAAPCTPCVSAERLFCLRRANGRRVPGAFRGRPFRGPSSAPRTKLNQARDEKRTAIRPGLRRAREGPIGRARATSSSTTGAAHAFLPTANPRGSRGHGRATGNRGGGRSVHYPVRLVADLLDESRCGRTGACRAPACARVNELSRASLAFTSRRLPRASTRLPSPAP
jgi:hypothetical protein